MGERLILVAVVGGAFGVRGEVRITTYTEDPAAIAGYRDLLRQDGSPGLTVVSARPAKAGVVARVGEVTTPEQADALRGLKLFIPRDRLPPPDDEDEFYLADLIGLSVVTPSGEPLGQVRAVQDFGAGDLLEIAPAAGGATWWLAFTREAVPEVSLAEGRLVAVRPEETE
ncbi:ribosome maturation factor RimM [Phenylobacterium sp.]|jgi:16S rRNA processing protein RimM|uniref:ribosome maturation factor RimM n=1 Tax=Phenylobacterium sp. TaxID=1871053 RepID=UPI002F3F5FF1